MYRTRVDASADVKIVYFFCDLLSRVAGRALESKETIKSPKVNGNKALCLRKRAKSASQRREDNRNAVENLDGFSVLCFRYRA